jgi:hypothetical protein
MHQMPSTEGRPFPAPVTMTDPLPVIDFEPQPIPTLRDRYKAECLRLMAEHAAIAPRGFDSQRDRAKLHRQWDDAYDRYQRCGG